MGLRDLLSKEKTADGGSMGADQGGGVVVPPTPEPEEKRGRGRPKGSSGKAGAGTVPSGLQDAHKAIIEELYKSALWSEVGAFPFNVRKVMTGSDVFTLTSKQKEILGTSLAMTMRSFGVVDPKYAALSVLLINFATIMAEMEVKYRAEKIVSAPDETEHDKAA